MARKDKAHCGAVVTSKRCMRCMEGVYREPGTCPRCKSFMPPWCEAWMHPGDRCTLHVDREKFPQHPEAPVDFHDSIAATAGPAGRAFNKLTEGLTLAEMAAELARTMLTRAIDSGDPRAVGAAVRALESAAAAADIERKAKKDDPLVTGTGHITINVNRMPLPERRPLPKPPEDE